MYSVHYTDRSVKNLKKIPEKWQERIVKTIDDLENNPFQGKKLQGELQGLFSLRVWPYRIIYSIQKEKITITIIDIG